MKKLTIFFNKQILQRISKKKGEVNNAQNEEKRAFLSPFIKQCFVTLGPLLLTISSGMTFGYSAILLPQLQHPTHPLNTSNSSTTSTLIINQEEASWIASMAALPMAVGSAFGGFFIEKMGRKSAHSVSCLPAFVGWILIYLATDKTMLLSGRFITGFVTGFLASATGIYISEMTDPVYRGFFLAGISTSVSLGIFISHLLGTFITWQNTALTCALTPMLAQITLFFAPESPVWLSSKNRKKEAEESFEYTRGSTKKNEAKIELSIILNRNESDGIRLKELVDGSLLCSSFIRPLLVISLYLIANQWTGINAVSFYAVTILKSTLNHDLNEYYALLIIDVIRLFISIISCLLLATCKRRHLAVISGIGTFIPLISLYFYIKFQITVDSVVIMLLLVFYIIFVNVGFVPLPWAMVGEVFPVKYRSVGGGVCSVAAFVAFFSVVKVLPAMLECWGIDGAFLCFGLVAFAGTVFVYCVLPETKGLALHLIEDKYCNNENSGDK